MYDYLITYDAYLFTAEFREMFSAAFFRFAPANKWVMESNREDIKKCKMYAMDMGLDVEQFKRLVELSVNEKINLFEQMWPVYESGIGLNNYC